MRHQSGGAPVARRRHQHVRGAAGAPSRLAGIFDSRMKTDMPEDARDHGPFGNPHLEQRYAGTGQRGLHEDFLGNQIRMGRERDSAFMGAPPAAGKNLREFGGQFGQFPGRQAGGRQPRRLIIRNVAGKARMPGAGPKRDMRLAMTDQNNAHGGNMFGGGQTNPSSARPNVNSGGAPLETVNPAATA